MVIVVDASLAVKWYLLERFTPEALDILGAHSGNIICPDIFITEVAGALVRRANMDKSLRPSSEDSLIQFASLFADELITAHPMVVAEITTASSLALALGHPLKDCIYLALAMELGCELVTCDARFAAKAKTIWPKVRVLAEL